MSGTQTVNSLPNDGTQVTIVTARFTYTFTLNGSNLTMVDAKKQP